LTDLNGKVAVLSGASRGIGKAIAVAFVKAGARVVIGSRKKENLDPVVEAINQDYPGSTVAVVAHAGHQGSSQELVDTAVHHFGRLDIAVKRQMAVQGEGGKIINIASVAGLTPGLMMGVYSVSKSAIIMMTKALAIELASENIQVNAIAPGFIKTRFSRALWSNPAINDSIISRTPARRMGNPDEICGIALYLASPESDFTTGATFTVDGGYILT